MSNHGTKIQTENWINEIMKICLHLQVLVSTNMDTPGENMLGSDFFGAMFND